MDKESFRKIFYETEIVEDSCYKGLQIIAKYIDDPIVRTYYGELYSETIETLIKAGITKEDTTELVKLGWSLDAGSNLSLMYYFPWT